MGGRRIGAMTAPVLVAAIGVVVSGCSGAATPSAVGQVSTAPTAAATLAATPTPAPTPDPTPSPTPEPTPDLAAIGAAYLAIADRFGTTGQPVIDQIADGGSYSEEEWGGLHQQVADAYDGIIAELDAIEFPDEIADDIAGIRSSWVKVRDLFLAVAADPSLDNWDEVVAEAEAYGARADRVREYLGLPPRPTPAS